jgi:hypothetical protein
MLPFLFFGIVVAIVTTQNLAALGRGKSLLPLWS